MERREKKKTRHCGSGTKKLSTHSTGTHGSVAGGITMWTSGTPKANCCMAGGIAVFTIVNGGFWFCFLSSTISAFYHFTFCHC